MAELDFKINTKCTFEVVQSNSFLDALISKSVGDGFASQTEGEYIVLVKVKNDGSIEKSTTFDPNNSQEFNDVHAGTAAGIEFQADRTIKAAGTPADGKIKIKVVTKK